MAESSGRAIFEGFLRATNARDTAAPRSVLHLEFEEIYPQSRERTRGADNLVAIMENYPSGGYVGAGSRLAAGAEDRWVMGPTFTLLKIEGTGDTFTGVQRVLYPDGTRWFAVTIGRIRDGRLWRAETYFGQDFEAPEWRRPWVEVEAPAT